MTSMGLKAMPIQMLHMSNYFQNIQISFKLPAQKKEKKKKIMQSPINERSELSHGLEFSSGQQEQ